MDAWKKYQVPLFILGVAVFVFALRAGKPLGKSHNQTFSGQENSTTEMFGERSRSRYGIPKIDPTNDPLAPRSKKKQEMKTTSSESRPSAKTVYEFPEGSPILPQ